MVCGITSPRYLTSPAFRTLVGVRPGTYVLETVLNAAAYLASWAVREFGGGDLAATEAAAARLPIGAEGLLTLPYWNAAQTPYWDPLARGAVVGWHGRHTPAHLYRSILEGIAMTMRERTDAMAAELGTAFDRVVVSGGGSSSDLMMQITADVFQRPTVRVVGDSAAGRGAAICAAVATGVHPSFADAVSAMVVERDRFEPDPTTASVYDALRAVHADVTAHTDALYRRTAAVVG